MIATTEHGVYLETNRSWSIDDRRLNFQFGTQNGWEIVGGKRHPPRTQPDLQRPDARVLGVVRRGRGTGRMADVRRGANCGKGQPSQLMHVGHGAAPCRFRNVRVEPAR